MGSNSLILPAPAKINLYLKIIGKRKDGYHLLDTAFQFLEFGDKLTLSVINSPQIIIETDSNIPVAENIVYLAALKLQDYVKKHDIATNKLGAKIEIYKNTPMGAGLGGGSSDAATTLVGLNKLWGLGLSVNELAKLGVKLGADVPVFIHGNAAFATGIGEILTPHDFAEQWMLILVPNCHVATKLMFANFKHKDLTSKLKASKICGLDVASTNGLQTSENDFEPIAKSLYKPVELAFQWFENTPKASKPKLSGSGGSVFASFTSEQAAMTALNRAKQELPGEFVCFVSKSINRSPLLNYI